MRYFHYKKNPHHMPCVNLDKVWSMIGLEQVSPPTLPPSLPPSSTCPTHPSNPAWHMPPCSSLLSSRALDGENIHTRISRDSLRPESSACQICEHAVRGAWCG